MTTHKKLADVIIADGILLELSATEADPMHDAEDGDLDTGDYDAGL